MVVWNNGMTWLIIWIIFLYALGLHRAISVIIAIRTSAFATFLKFFCNLEEKIAKRVAVESTEVLLMCVPCWRHWAACWATTWSRNARWGSTVSARSTSPQPPTRMALLRRRSYCCPHQRCACALHSRDPLPRRRYPRHRRLDGRGYQVGRMKRQSRDGFRLVIGWWRESTPIIKYFLLSNLSAQRFVGKQYLRLFLFIW